MAEKKITKRGRGRPRLAPEENETRERILQAAQRLFDERSFSQVNVREITEEAGVNLAAVNYYFSSKEQLILVLVRRAAKALIQERARLLEEAERTGGSREEQLRNILFALLRPVIEKSINSSDAPSGRVSVIYRDWYDTPPGVRAQLEGQTTQHQPFALALGRLFPELSLEEIYWRLHFVLGIEYSISAEGHRLAVMSGGLCALTDADKVTRRIIEFVVPGWLAPVKAGRAKAPENSAAPTTGG